MTAVARAATELAANQGVSEPTRRCFQTAATFVADQEPSDASHPALQPEPCFET